MIELSLGDLAEVVGGRLDAADPGVVVSGPASVDSRTVAPGGLFVAIAGERVDGHDYAAAAVEAGAGAVLGSRPTGAPTVVVDDVVAGLGRLAAYVAERLPDTTVLALTGSQGKTGTKDYLAHVLTAHAPTVATQGNFNNEIGVPLTVLRATPETRFLVLEMGARGIGHIRYLCGLARPRIAAVLNVGTAHLGEFGSREAIAVAKGEIVEALPADGVAVLNADDPLTAAMASRTDARVLTFGRSGDLTWTDEKFDDLDRPTATFALGEQRATTSLTQSGAHQLANAAAAAAMAVAAGLELPEVVASLGRATSASPWRMELHDLPGDGVLVNDSYNANPASMRAALDAVAQIGVRRGARTIAVLSEMRELGADSAHEHAAVGAAVAERGFDVLLVIGDAARPMLEGAAEVTDSAVSGVYAADRAEALAWLREELAPGDVVLVKASRGAELDKLATAVVEEHQ